MAERFEAMLTGGHPNSLGRTEDVVALVLESPRRFEELFSCYESADEVVRLRTSSAVKRVAIARKELVTPYLDRLIDEIGDLDQASAQWTLAQLFDKLEGELTPEQKGRAQAVMQRNLANHNDWIVLNMTMETLGKWARRDAKLRRWMMPHLERLAEDSRKSVARKATKKLEELD